MDEVLLPMVLTVAIWLLSIVTGFLVLWAVIRGAVLSALRTRAAEQRSEQGNSAAQV